MAFFTEVSFEEPLYPQHLSVFSTVESPRPPPSPQAVLSNLRDEILALGREPEIKVPEWVLDELPPLRAVKEYTPKFDMPQLPPPRASVRPNALQIMDLNSKHDLYAVRKKEPQAYLKPLVHSKSQPELVRRAVNSALERSSSSWTKVIAPAHPRNAVASIEQHPSLSSKVKLESPRSLALRQQRELESLRFAGTAVAESPRSLALRQQRELEWAAAARQWGGPNFEPKQRRTVVLNPFQAGPPPERPHAYAFARGAGSTGRRRTGGSSVCSSLHLEDLVHFDANGRASLKS